MQFTRSKICHLGLTHLEGISTEHFLARPTLTPVARNSDMGGGGDRHRIEGHRRLCL